MEKISSKLYNWASILEAKAREQAVTASTMPFIWPHYSLMPDVHWGMGATVGSVIAQRNAVSPAAVGVDIGCGMGAIRTNLMAKDLPESLAELRRDLEASIPVGFSQHDSRSFRNDGETNKGMKDLFSRFATLDPAVKDLEGKARKQIGSLGGGNHFIELCVAQDGAVWMMLHSGSRNIGKTLAEIHITKARGLQHNEALPDRDLAVFLAKTPEMEAYRRDLYWAQEYAFLNRTGMFELYKEIMIKHFPQVTFEAPIMCHHNYVREEMHFGEELFVTRKGAIFAGTGARGIIPGSMGTKSYIVTGLGNPDSLFSASHGAGRRMSRGRAKKEFTLEDLAKQTEGVECRKDQGVLDEIPGAYKDISKVMEYQKDLVHIDHELRQVMCIKG